MALLAGLLAMPYVISALMLGRYYEIDEPFSRQVGILLAIEYQAPLVYGALPILMSRYVQEFMATDAELQHEVDHLDGVLAVPRAIDSRSIVLRRARPAKEVALAGVFREIDAELR